MKCIQCGKDIQRKKAVLCNACTKEHHTCLKGFTEYTILICSSCNRYKFKKHWKHPKKTNDAIIEATKAHLVFQKEPKKTAWAIDLLEQQGKKQKGTITLKTITTVDRVDVEEEFVFPLKITHTTCDTCAITKTKYFEGILQLRGENEKTIQQVHDFILEETKRKNKEGVFINKVNKLKNGFDFYYTKQRYIPIIGQKLQQEFGATFATSAQLFTRKDGKDLYRVNAIVRLPAYEIGDIVEYKNNIVQIESIAKKTKARNIQTQKPIVIDPKETTLLVKKQEFHTVEITKWFPQLEVLHPTTYESTPIVNQQTISKKTKQIQVAIIDEQLWLVE